MKFLIYTPLFLFTCLVFSQEKNSRQYDFILLENCETSASARKCFQTEFANCFIKNLKKKDLTSIINEFKNDTVIKGYAFITTKKSGKIDIETSYINLNKLNKTSNYQYILKKLPNVKPKLDALGIPEPFTTSIFFNLKINTSKNSLSYIKNSSTQNVELNFVQKAPVYYNCNRALDNKQLLKCASKKMNTIISKHFNTDILAKHYISGKKVKIYMFFTVNHYGEIEAIKIDTPLLEIEAEAKRVLSLIPNFNEPAITNFSPTKVTFSLPLTFTLN